MDADTFPDLVAEADRLAFARRARDRMIARLEAVDPDGAADEITKDSRTTAIDSLGLDFRRRFTLDEGTLVAYLDEHLDDPEAGEAAVQPRR